MLLCTMRSMLTDTQHRVYTCAGHLRVLGEILQWISVLCIIHNLKKNHIQNSKSVAMKSTRLHFAFVRHGKKKYDMWYRVSN